MSPELLSTKLFTPPIRKNLVLRSRLTEQLNEGLEAGCKLTLISASAGFGKTTLVSEWFSAVQGILLFYQAIEISVAILVAIKILRTDIS